MLWNKTKKMMGTDITITILGKENPIKDIEHVFSLFHALEIVGIDSPFSDNEIFAILELENKAISTSGNYKRKWNIQNQEYNHIINPITGTNNNEITSISLIADHCYLADAYATACIAMGVNKTLIFLRENSIDGVVIGADKKTYATGGIKKYNIQYS